MDAAALNAKEHEYCSKRKKNPENGRFGPKILSSQINV